MGKSKLLLLALVGWMAAGCGGAGSGLTGQQSPRIRLFNGVFGEASVFASYQDANLANLGDSPDAPYGTATTDTLVTNTNVTATIQATTGALVTSPPALLRVNSDYTAFGFGAALPGYRAMILQDSQATAPGAAFGVRTLNIGSKSASVDVYIQPGTGAAPPTGLLFSNLAYGTVSGATNTTSAVDANGYVVEPTNGITSYTVTVTPHNSLTVLATDTATLSQGGYFTVVVYDSPFGSATQTSVAVLGDRRTG